MSLAAAPTPSLESVSASLARAVDFLSSRQMSNGLILEAVADPLAVLTRPETLSQNELFHAMAGADIWNTVNTMSVFKQSHRDISGMESGLSPFLARLEGLSYWSAKRGLCCETTAAMALIAEPIVQEQLREVLRRHALPKGRWASFILDISGGYESYIVGPSVTAWSLSALGPEDPLYPPGLDYLEESLADRPIWGIHQAFYETPFYPAHRATLLLPKESVLQYTLDTQDASGGWAFGDPPTGPACVLPTAFAVQTLQGFPLGERSRLAMNQGIAWLLGQQGGDGAFPLGAAPSSVWYVGQVYSTCCACFALLAWIREEAKADNNASG